MIKVSAAITFSGQTNSLKRVLSVIDDAHTDGKLPNAIVRELKLTEECLGQYSYSKTISSIRIAQPYTQNEFTFLHEIGHFLDHRVLGGTSNEFASNDANKNELDQWMIAVLNSRTIQELRNCHNSGDTGGGFTSYLLEPAEIWARCYAQWVTMRTQDTTLLWHLRDALTSGKKFRRLSQWDKDDFEPIQDAINAVFTFNGWLL